MTRLYTAVRRTACAVCNNNHGRWMCDICDLTVCTGCGHTCAGGAS
jgi:hypothetical protein